MEESREEILRRVFGDSSESEEEWESEPDPDRRWVEVEGIKGLWMCRGFLSPLTQSGLLRTIQNEGWFSEASNQAMRFGGLPGWAAEISDNIKEAVLSCGSDSSYVELGSSCGGEKNVVPFPPEVLAREPLFDQLILNSYQPGEGICAHVDLMRFEDGIAILSLASSCVMHFSSVGETSGEVLVDEDQDSRATKIPVYLTPGSLILMSGQARYQWKHEINRKPGFQKWQGEELDQKKRISITLRKLCQALEESKILTTTMEDHTAGSEELEYKAKVELRDIEKAIELAEKKFEAFQRQRQLPSVSVQRCYEKAAQLAAQIEKYPKAIKMYDNLAQFSLRQGLLLEHKAKQHLLNAGICRFCDRDVSAAIEMAKEHAGLPTFSNTWECKFLQNISEAVEKHDHELFATHFRRFNSMTPLDSYATSLLVRVEEKLKRPIANRRTHRPTSRETIARYTKLYEELIAELNAPEANRENVEHSIPMFAALQRSKTTAEGKFPTIGSIAHSKSSKERSDGSNKQDGVRKLGGKPMNWILQKGTSLKRSLSIAKR